MGYQDSTLFSNVACYFTVTKHEQSNLKQRIENHLSGLLTFWICDVRIKTLFFSNTLVDYDFRKQIYFLGSPFQLISLQRTFVQMLSALRRVPCGLEILWFPRMMHDSHRCLPLFLSLVLGLIFALAAKWGILYTENGNNVSCANLKTIYGLENKTSSDHAATKNSKHIQKFKNILNILMQYI